MITVKEVTTKRQRKQFFRFPIDLYKGVANSCPSLISDEEDEFDPQTNGAFYYADCKMFLAYDEQGKVVGRVAAILNKAYNEKSGENQMRFSRFDFIDDLRVSKALIEAVCGWARTLGMDKLVGPIGFSDLDKQGMLVDGFDKMNLYLTVYNFPYYPRHMEALGLSKIVDWVEYRIAIPEKADERQVALADKIMKRYGFRFIETHGAKKSKELVINALKDIWNEAYAPLYGVVQINERQIEREYNMLKIIWDDDNLAAVEKDGELIAYGFVAPNLSRALSKCNGKLFPTGIFHLLHDVKHYTETDMYSIGVKKQYKNTGVNFVMVMKIIQNFIKNGVKYTYTGPMLETNHKILGQWKPFNPELWRRRRCYGMDIPAASDVAEQAVDQAQSDAEETRS